jgi:hypothetical protein
LVGSATGALVGSTAGALVGSAGFGAWVAGAGAGVGLAQPATRTTTNAKSTNHIVDLMNWFIFLSSIGKSI